MAATWVSSLQKDDGRSTSGFSTNDLVSSSNNDKQKTDGLLEEASRSQGSQGSFLAKPIQTRRADNKEKRDGRRLTLTNQAKSTSDVIEAGPSPRRIFAQHLSETAESVVLEPELVPLTGQWKKKEETVARL